MRRSKQRDLLLEIVKYSKDHLTAEEIYQTACLSIPNISLGTVYRNLSQLEQLDLIIRIKTKEGKDRFDNMTRPHQHFICEECHTITDIYHDFNLSKNLLPNSKISHYTIEFYGICEDCLKKKEEKQWN